MKPDLAERVANAFHRVTAELESVLATVSREGDPDEFEPLRDLIGHVNTRFLIEVLDPIYREHPDLRPLKFSGDYKIPSGVFQGVDSLMEPGEVGGNEGQDAEIESGD